MEQNFMKYLKIICFQRSNDAIHINQLLYILLAVCENKYIVERKSFIK